MEIIHTAALVAAFSRRKEKNMIDLYEYWIQNGHKALEKYCQEYINALPTINQTTADAIKNGNLMSNENIYVCEVIDTKAKTIFGIHRAFLNSIFKWGIDKNIHCFLREYIPYIKMALSFG